MGDNQVWWEALLFFIGGGIVGFSLRIGWVLISSGQRKLSVVDDYLEENSLVVAFGVFCYIALVALWLWTDALGLLGGVGESIGIVPGVLNAWTVLFAFASDVVLMMLINKFGEKIGADRLSERLSQAMPKMSKTNELQEPPKAP